MAFVVQQAIPIDGANAYITVDEFKAYHSDRGNSIGAATDEQIKASIIKATQYVDIRFEYVGYRYYSVQTTEWPRSAAYDDRSQHIDGVPFQVKNGTAEYALRQLTSEILPDPVLDDTGMQVKSKQEVVGPIAERIEYMDYADVELPKYPLADRILSARGITLGGPSNGGLSVGSVGRS